ncbi:DUF2218 domain-containing protein [Corynebacterium sp.]|uniref:DUF2218 domain-containing protein n=1 Tax=Corynebacterium sp. TaxID=1720 RepID=UPI0026DEBAB9|nr:DUF2218 domain-containing protein [Corynebacterium sp.]MDO5512114.1 DUF2218 domain-containing protein [Corynebacterium sp.]
MTTSSTARVRCEKPRRLAKSLVSRFDEVATTEWWAEEGRGHVTFSSGAVVDLIAGDGVLLVHLECAAADVAQWEESVGRRIADLDETADWKRAGVTRG